MAPFLSFFFECDILERHYFENVIRCSEIDDWARQSAEIWWLATCADHLCVMNLFLEIDLKIGMR